MQRGRDSRLDSPGMCSKLNFQNLEPGLGVDTVPLLVRFHGQCRRLNAFWLSLQDSCFRTPSCHSKRLSPILSLDIWDTLPRRQMYKGAREMSSQGWR
jgi:hypothetical protein